MFSWNCMRSGWTWIREWEGRRVKKKQKTNTSMERGRCFGCVFPQVLDDFSSQIMNDMPPLRNYAQTQRDADKIFTPPRQGGMAPLTASTTLVVFFWVREAERFAARRGDWWRGTKCELNICWNRTRADCGTCGRSWLEYFFFFFLETPALQQQCWLFCRVLWVLCIMILKRLNSSSWETHSLVVLCNGFGHKILDKESKVVGFS